ncbi:Fic-domain-containing protein [Parathielavia appendiculata]|uniref:Fic-domain-containing protein n=1 Tax=Parathielavia appendiculata TaxID=2587402 RepID=A0AAN6TQX3_9PEZI|nr:Fic-domain-containing protein [Parathielavia appendiculata]
MDSHYDTLVRLIYGSIMIESAGSSLDITRQLCTAAFRGQNVTAHISDTDPNHGKHLAKSPASRQPRRGCPHVFESKIFSDGWPWSEELILDTHRILHRGLYNVVGAGEYRTYEVAVKYEKPERCPDMRDMVEHLNSNVAGAERLGRLNPSTLAARYHHQFVNIHPFGDGNGRMSRIILKALLLQLRCVSVFGLDAQERDDYIGIATRASKVFHAEDMEVDFSEHTGHLKLTKFVLANAQRMLV